MPRRKKVMPEAAKGLDKRNDKIPPRLLGMKDLVGSDCRYYDFIVDKVREYAKLYSFTPIKTPILESYDLYKKSTRRSTGKEFYFVEGEKNEKITLRPEMTQGVVRAYLENNLGESGQPVRFFAMKNCRPAIIASQLKLIGKSSAITSHLPKRS